jgi:hypothetical protein
MAKFDVQTLKKHIASVMEIHRDMRREVCDALNSSNGDRHYKYEDAMTLYMRKSILDGEIDMAERVLYLIRTQEKGE